MKKMFMLLTVVCALAVSALAQNNSFAGTWVLDKAKSEIPGPMGERLKGLTWTITQDASAVKVEPKMEMAEGQGGGRGGGMMGGAGPRTLKLDGSETVAENPRGKTTSKVKASDGKLDISSVMNMSTPNGDFTMNSTEKWELADGGKTLKVTTTRQTPNGEMVTKYHFNKQ